MTEKTAESRQNVFWFINILICQLAEGNKMGTVDLGKMTERELLIKHDGFFYADPHRMESEEKKEARKQQMNDIELELERRGKKNPRAKNRY